MRAKLTPTLPLALARALPLALVLVAFALVLALPARAEDPPRIALALGDEELEKPVSDMLAGLMLKTSGGFPAADARELAKSPAAASRAACELGASGHAGFLLLGTLEVVEQRESETAATASVEVKLVLFGGRSGERLANVVRREKASAAEKARALTKAREAAITAATKALTEELPKALAADGPLAVKIEVREISGPARLTHQPAIERALAAAGLEVAAKRHDAARSFLEIEARVSKGSLDDAERRLRAALEAEDTGAYLHRVDAPGGVIAFAFKDPYREVAVVIEGVDEGAASGRGAGSELASAFSSLSGVQSVDRATDPGTRLLTLKLVVRGRLSDLDAAIASARSEPLADLRLLELRDERLRYRLVVPSDRVVVEIDGIAVETSSIGRFEGALSGLPRVKAVERSANAALVQVRWTVTYSGKPSELAAAFENALEAEKDLPPLIPSVPGPGADVAYRATGGSFTRLLLRVTELPQSVYATAGAKLNDIIAGLEGVKVVERTYDPDKERLELVLETPPSAVALDVRIWKATRGVPELVRLAPGESRARTLGYSFLSATPDDFATTVRVTRLAPEAYSTDGRLLVEAIRALEGATKVEAAYDRDARELVIKLRYKAPPHELEDALWRALAGRTLSRAFTADRRAGSEVRISFIERAGDSSRVFVRFEGATDDASRRAISRLVEWLKGLEGTTEVELDATGEVPQARLWSKKPPIAIYDAIARALADDRTLAPLAEGRLEENVVVVRGAGASGSGTGQSSGFGGPVAGAGQKLPDLVARLDPTLVFITMEIDLPTEKGTISRTPVWTGSGFLVSPRGYLLTNYHVAGPPGDVPAEACHLVVKLHDGRTLEARFIDGNPHLDLALLKLPGDHFPSAAIGDSDALRPGDSLVILGNPLGLEHSVTTGIVSGVDRDQGHVQTNALITHGNSGGPAFDERGRVIGIATWGKTRGRLSLGGGKQVEIPEPGINFLVPINQALPLLQMSGAKADK